MYISLVLQMGKWSNSYLFFRRTLKWDIKEYSTYITAYGLLGMVATYLLMPFLTDYLKLRDTTILMVRLKSGSFRFLLCTSHRHFVLLHTFQPIKNTTQQSTFQTVLSNIKNIFPWFCCLLVHQNF